MSDKKKLVWLGILRFWVKASHIKASQPHFPHFPRFRVRIFRVFRVFAPWSLLRPLFVGVQETVLLVNRAIVPPKRGGFWRKRRKWRICILTSKTRALLLKPREPTKMTKMAGVPRAKAWFTKSTVSWTPMFFWSERDLPHFPVFPRIGFESLISKIRPTGFIVTWFRKSDRLALLWPALGDRDSRTVSEYCSVCVSHAGL